MAFAPVTDYDNFLVIGQFQEKEFGKIFEFKLNNSGLYPEYNYQIYVGGIHGDETRFANIKKTVAYVLTDEDSEPEKWQIKNHRLYSKSV